MIPEGGERVSAIFEAALKCDPAGRAALLDERCAGDPALRAEVERLLGDDERAARDSFLTPQDATDRDTGDARLSPLRLRGLELHICCPHCRCPIELVGLPTTEDVICPTCGSTFRLDRESTAPWSPRRGQRQLGRFELIETVGVGAFGTVYKARDPQLARTVAIKVPRAGSLATDEDRDRFLREARSVAQLRHASIVPVHEVGEYEGLPFLVSDFVQGMTLSDLLTGRRPPPREAAQLVAAVADALHYAHEQGVVHRDVKPSNILLDDAGRPHLMDFGLAKREAGEITMTIDGQVLGTPAYMSPEQARGEGHKVDGRSDLYSLGAILYELLTGELPFRGNQRMLLHQVLHDEPRSPRSLNDRIPRDLETICLKAMAKDTSRRYTTARELADDLRRFEAGQPIHARPVSRAETLWRWCRRNPVVASLFASVASLLLVISVGSTLSLRIVEAKRDEAEKSADRAEKSAARAEEARGAEKAAGEKLRHQLYISDMNQGQQAWESADMTRLVRLLDRHRPGPGQDDLRSFEWYYLWRLAHGYVRSVDEAANCVAFSPDGRTLATGSREGPAKLWDLATGALRATLSGHRDPVAYIAFAPDGQSLATSTLDRSAERVQVWDLTGKSKMVFGGSGEGERVGGPVAFSPDGRTLAAVSPPNTVRLWDLGTREPTDLPGRGMGAVRIYALAFSPDGKSLVACYGGDKNTVSAARFWDLATRRQAETRVEAPGEYFSAMALSLDGNKLALGSRWLPIHLHDLRSRETMQLPGPWAPDALTFSPDGQVLASGAPDRQIYLWDTTTGQIVGSLKGHGSPIRSLAYSPDGRLLASGGEVVRLWNRSTGEQESDLISQGEQVDTIVFSPDGKLLVSGGTDGSVKLWDVEKRRLNGSPLKDRGSPVVGLAISPDGRTIAVGLEDGTLESWDVGNRKRDAAPLGEGKPIQGLAFSPDGRSLAVGVGDYTPPGFAALLLVDRATGRPRWSHRIDAHIFLAVAFSPDGSMLASCGFPNSVWLWDAASGERLWLRHDPDSPSYFTSVAFSPDGRTLAAGDEQGRAITWGIPDGRPLIKFTGHVGWVRRVGYSSDGRTLATASYDDTVRLWDATTGEVKLILRGHSGWVRGLAFSSDGRVLATAAGDGTIRLWRAASESDVVARER